ncbi:MAG: LysE family transporter [Alphaproteobacteria bacterium]|nr:LysE family transporter [Alphaproteobacteria bacterium]NCQ66810.1 LysE family transporter [Alphaproteobacteria bacterium]NCT07378.1 LysE family transporter [Alphaproteobacteria bacterium]
MEVAFILKKLVLGMTLAAPIGPVSVEMIKRGLSHGFLAAFSVRLGGALGNSLCLLAAYYGLSFLMSYPSLFNGLGIVGALLLIYTGYKSLKKTSDDLNFDETTNMTNGLQWGLYLAIANPFAFIFWTGIFATTLDSTKAVDHHIFFENLLIIAGVLIWGAGLSTVLGFGHRFLNKKVIVRLSQLASLFMLYFGLKYLWVICNRLSVTF